MHCALLYISSSLHGVVSQVAHERSSVELQAVCMEVAGDCLPNVVVSFRYLNLLSSSESCWVVQCLCKSAKFGRQDKTFGTAQLLHDDGHIIHCISRVSAARSQLHWEL